MSWGQDFCEMGRKNSAVQAPGAFFGNVKQRGTGKFISILHAKPDFGSSRYRPLAKPVF
jgi:hypothetical protein